MRVGVSDRSTGTLTTGNGTRTLSRAVPSQAGTARQEKGETTMPNIAQDSFQPAKRRTSLSNEGPPIRTQHLLEGRHTPRAPHHKADSMRPCQIHRNLFTRRLRGHDCLDAQLTPLTSCWKTTLSASEYARLVVVCVDPNELQRERLRRPRQTSRWP